MYTLQRKDSDKDLDLKTNIELEKCTWDRLHRLYTAASKSKEFENLALNIEKEICTRKNGLKQLDEKLEEYIEKNGNKKPSEYSVLNFGYRLFYYKTNQEFAVKARKVTQPALVSYDLVETNNDLKKHDIIIDTIKKIKSIYDEMIEQKIASKQVLPALEKFLNVYHVPLSKEDYEKCLKHRM